MESREDLCFIQRGQSHSRIVGGSHGDSFSGKDWLDLVAALVMGHMVALEIVVMSLIMIEAILEVHTGSCNVFDSYNNQASDTGCFGV